MRLLLSKYLFHFKTLIVLCLFTLIGLTISLTNRQSDFYWDLWLTSVKNEIKSSQFYTFKDPFWGTPIKTTYSFSSGKEFNLNNVSIKQLTFHSQSKKLGIIFTIFGINIEELQNDDLLSESIEKLSNDLLYLLGNIYIYKNGSQVSYIDLNKINEIKFEYLKSMDEDTQLQSYTISL